MKTLGAIAIIIGFTFVGLSVQQSDEKVNLALYYEPMCPYSVDFIVKSLAPYYPELSTILNVTLNPYGNAERKKVNGHWQFECQHGVNECEMAKIIACSLQDLDQRHQVELAGCFTNLSLAKQCIADVQLNYVDILSCANGDLGEELLAKYGEETDALVPPHTFVPYLVFNGVYNADLQTKALADFVETVCSLVHTKLKPPACLKDDDDLIYLSFKKDNLRN